MCTLYTGPCFKYWKDHPEHAACQYAQRQDFEGLGCGLLAYPMLYRLILVYSRNRLITTARI